MVFLGAFLSVFQAHAQDSSVMAFSCYTSCAPVNLSASQPFKIDTKIPIAQGTTLRVLSPAIQYKLDTVNTSHSSGGNPSCEAFGSSIEEAANCLAIHLNHQTSEKCGDKPVSVVMVSTPLVCGDCNISKAKDDYSGRRCGPVKGIKPAAATYYPTEAATAPDSTSTNSARDPFGN
jgi:hypothetical protein